MKLFHRILTLTILLSSAGVLQTAHAGTCTPAQVEKLVDKGFSKEEIKDLCGTQKPAAPAEPARFTDNKDGTVTDNTTGLMWQKKDDGHSKSWGKASEYCKGLTLAGQKDWSLPSKEELETLLSEEAKKEGRSFFAIGETFPYWSSTPGKGNSHYALPSSLNNGIVSYYGAEGGTYARCARRHQ
ncbi:MAG: DUF1566 domain-containing protein [Nitrospinae bacterium]|nr:DUF1566 domain-containing protein [Nitrospinota bacterium]